MPQTPQNTVADASPRGRLGRWLGLAAAGVRRWDWTTILDQTAYRAAGAGWLLLGAAVAANAGAGPIGADVLGALAMAGGIIAVLAVGLAWVIQHGSAKGRIGVSVFAGLEFLTTLIALHSLHVRVWPVLKGWIMLGRGS